MNSSGDFDCMLSVYVICFEDRFYASKKGRIGGHSYNMQCTWQLSWLAIEKPWLVPARPVHYFLVQTSV